MTHRGGECLLQLAVGDVEDVVVVVVVDVDDDHDSDENKEVDDDDSLRSR